MGNVNINDVLSCIVTSDFDKTTVESVLEYLVFLHIQEHKHFTAGNAVMPTVNEYIKFNNMAEIKSDEYANSLRYLAAKGVLVVEYHLFMFLFNDCSEVGYLRLEDHFSPEEIKQALVDDCIVLPGEKVPRLYLCKHIEREYKLADINWGEYAYYNSLVMLVLHNKLRDVNIELDKARHLYNTALANFEEIDGKHSRCFDRLLPGELAKFKELLHND